MVFEFHDSTIYYSNYLQHSVCSGSVASISPAWTTLLLAMHVYCPLIGLTGSRHHFVHRCIQMPIRPCLLLLVSIATNFGSRRFAGSRRICTIFRAGTSHAQHFQSWNLSFARWLVFFLCSWSDKVLWKLYLFDCWMHINAVGLVLPGFVVVVVFSIASAVLGAVNVWLVPFLSGRWDWNLRKHCCYSSVLRLWMLLDRIAQVELRTKPNEHVCLRVALGGKTCRSGVSGREYFVEKEQTKEWEKQK